MPRWLAGAALLGIGWQAVAVCFGIGALAVVLSLTLRWHSRQRLSEAA
jgi:hypothetical protein